MKISNEINKTNHRSQWPLSRTLLVLGLKRSVYFAWKKRAEREGLEDKTTGRKSLSRILPEEEKARLGG